MRFRLLFAVLLPLMFSATPVRAQKDVARVVDRLATLWARGDASAIAEMTARAGASLDVDGKPMGPLGQRQIAAMLRKLFDERETMAVRTLTTKAVGGQPSRAFGEMSWQMRARGTTIPEKTTVFIAFILEDERWQITEIRFVQP